jgi:hypothetical protein
MTGRPPRITLALLSLSLVLAGGCASRGEKMVQSFARTRETVTEAQRQVDTTLVALHALRSTPAQQLTDGFRRYKSSVEKLEKQGADATWRGRTMQEEADEHVRAWQKEMETLNDPAMKASLESRRQAVRTNFKLLQMYAQDARNAYNPYLAGNKECVRALSIDLSPAAISSLSPSIDRILQDGATLKEKLAAMQYAMNNIAAGVSPIGATE